MTSSATFTQEPQLKQRLNTEIASFWQQGIFSSFPGVNNARINYAYFPKNDMQKCLIIINGRNESYLKYQELSFDFAKQGYQVFLLDHRGQGLSERLLPSEYKGYVEDFQHYISDLNTFVDEIVLPQCQHQPYLLAHSMGGAIAARFLQDYPNKIQAAVLASPMIGFNSGAAPNVIAEYLIKGLNAFNQLVDDTPWYLLGHQDYQPTPFADNVLTHSKLRYKAFSLQQEERPEIQLGGVTLKWLVEGMKAQQAIFSNIDKISTPTMVLQASKDTVVDNEAQTDFCIRLHQRQPQSCPEAKPTIIEGALHELFFEKDIYRNQALDAVLNWFNLHPTD